MEYWVFIKFQRMLYNELKKSQVRFCIAKYVFLICYYSNMSNEGNVICVALLCHVWDCVFTFSHITDVLSMLLFPPIKTA